MLTKEYICVILLVEKKESNKKCEKEFNKKFLYFTLCVFAFYRIFYLFVFAQRYVYPSIYLFFYRIAEF